MMVDQGPGRQPGLVSGAAGGGCGNKETGMKVAISGFGAQGRAIFRQLQDVAPIEVAAVLDDADPDALALLARRDSVRGAFPGGCELTDGCLATARGTTRILAVRDGRLPDWRALGVTIVVETGEPAAAYGQPTGVDREVGFTDRAGAHLAAGARQVVLAGPARRAVTQVILRGTADPAALPAGGALTAGSGLANCLAVLAVVLDDAFGLAQGLATATGPAGADQSLVDAPHGDPRRGRAAGLSLVPTAAGAAAEVARALPHLADRLATLSLRSPVAAGTAVELVAFLREGATAAAVNDAMRAAAARPGLAGVLALAEDPLVSADIAGQTLSCLFDPGCTRVVGKHAVGVLGWCDEEWAAAARTCDLLGRLADQG